MHARDGPTDIVFLITRLHEPGVGIAARSLTASLPWWLAPPFWVSFIEWSVAYLVFSHHSVFAWDSTCAG